MTSNWHAEPCYTLDERLDYWRTAFASPRLEKLIVNQLMLKGFFVDVSEFQEISGRVFDLLARTLTGAGLRTRPDDQAAILSRINGTRSLSVLRDLNAFVILEDLITGILSRRGLLAGITAMEFPANIRVAHGSAPQGYLNTPYPTDLLHADVWAGEPEDIINGILYVGGDISSTYVELYDFELADAKVLATWQGGYHQPPSCADHLKQASVTPHAGQLFLFDGICPHRTVRTGGGARISIDFRLRRSDPYGVIDDRWNQPQQAFSRYWALNSSGAESFDDKCHRELELLRARNDTAALAARNASIADLRELAATPPSVKI